MASKLRTRLLPERFTQAVLRSLMADSSLEARLFCSHFRVTDASPGQVQFEVDIQRHHTNILNTLHGGALASLVDLGGSLAVASMGHFSTGVSTDLNVSFLAAGGNPGDTIYGTAKCDRIGRRMAFTSIIFRKSTSELIARGSHTKYLLKTVDDEDLYTLPNDVASEDKTEHMIKPKE